MAQLIGVARIGRDAELRALPDGTPVTNLALAFDYGRKGEDGRRPTQWVEASLWGRQAEALVEYLTKGQQVYVIVDDIHIETYEGRNGGGSKLVGRIQTINLCGGGSSQERQQASRPQQSAPRQSAPRQQQRPQPQQSYDDYDDDIPF